jgi:hypothetical protein
MGTGLLPEVTYWGLALNVHPQIAPMLKEGESNTSTARLSHRGLLRGEIYVLCSFIIKVLKMNNRKERLGTLSCVIGGKM